MPKLSLFFTGIPSAGRIHQGFLTEQEITCKPPKVVLG